MDSISHAVELLAPARNLEVGRVAIDAGADAVYIGGPSFGARKAAGNSLEDIALLCAYAHRFSAKVLVTLNTLLISEEEMREAVRLAYAYREIGVDAIIMQDLRLARYLFQTGDFSSPNGIRLHASTQCDNRTLERVQELERMGFRRVVLARELSYKEIAHIRAHTKCELEAFVHGALCVSYSGACYLSEAVCGRSANRGECAQFCRLPYDVLDSEGRELLHQKHVLSLCDLDRSASLRDLLLTGVTTLKIEGRLKDADYVRNVVAYYRRLLDELGVPSSSKGRCVRAFEANPEKTFHRGATDYFSFGRPRSMANFSTPKSTGEYLGKAPLSAAVLASLHNGDGLTYAGEGFYWPNSRVRIPAGVEVYRNFDADFQRQLLQKDACMRVLPVDLRFEETEEGFALSIGDVRVTLQANKIPAENAERAEAVVRQQLSKLGGTGLEVASVVVNWSQAYFLPASVLNDLRRRAVEAFLPAPKVPQEVTLPSLPLPAVEPAPLPETLMTCRYCLFHEMGCCRKEHPSGPIPAFLRGQNGLLLRIHTHCAECYMTLTREN